MSGAVERLRSTFVQKALSRWPRRERKRDPGQLREVAHVRPEGSLRKRWFTARDCELFVWENAADEIVGLQFCYEAPHGREAVEWREGGDLHHAQVIETSVAMKNRTHTMQFDAADARAAALVAFDAASQSLEPRLNEFVRAKLTRSESPAQ